jgi:hypothetical protein
MSHAGSKCRTDQAKGNPEIFYPALERHYARVIDEWYQARFAELSAE